MPRIRILSAGSALPARRVSNDELAKTVDTTDEWIRQRTGIAARHIAGEGEETSVLAAAAARQALDRAGMTAADIDLVILATTTPDHIFPATAVKVQHMLGIKGAAMDVQAVCAGFVYGVSVARGLMLTGQGRRALVIGAETLTRLVDWEDRGTCVLFGDGAGAAVVALDDSDGPEGILDCRIKSDGQYYDLLMVPERTMIMNGREVFRHAVGFMGESIVQSLAAGGCTAESLDWLVPHQANARIISALGDKLDLPSEKIVLTVDHHGNTSAASIPLALAEATGDGRIKPGHTVLMTAMGGGFAWGSVLARWG